MSNRTREGEDGKMFFAVGNNVEWDAAPAHLGWLNPFEIYKIERGWAMLKWVSTPVRLSSLRKI